MSSRMSGEFRHMYVYACHDTERELCELEMLRLFDTRPHTSSLLAANRLIAPDVSPFIRLRLDVLTAVSDLDELAVSASELVLEEGTTFKVTFIKEGDGTEEYTRQREIEREIGLRIRGKAKMKEPAVVFGVIRFKGQWLLGRCVYSDRSWLERRHKPQNYSTGLPVLAAKALVNLAAPYPEAVRLLDPCCGMGNVVIEALMNGIDIRGNDMNPRAVQGARVNLRHYGFREDLVTLGDMNLLEGRYDTAILDMPYNLCSVLTQPERARMLNSLRRLAVEAVVVSIEPIRAELLAAGWKIEGECRLYKGERGGMIRDIYFCK
ncbi:methyltransferase domain-containing protein [Paenibacillus sp. P96]|uniref:Methyltransferase domain-containing protein n=1 Tax=Paenibacillus zeirhizosphaerae TaxID=2987519 RepID=A0ABT9FW61_9BACL|nr:methyltransferase domain-containing protein [Paenibacillus sp. P96]MDP4098969.1 methyltransferase domain-containing protein [Paenibacillus sp. P96]